jgi:hypothetical protein
MPGYGQSFQRGGHASLCSAVEPVEIAERCREELDIPRHKP